MQTIKVIETPYDLEEREIVCYPNLNILFKINVFRMFMKPRVFYSPITVDLVKGNAARSNMFPDSESIDIYKKAIVPALITTEKAIEEAKSLLIRWARHKFKIYKVPEIEIVKQEKAHKVFFYSEINNEKVLVDSIKGVELK